LNSKTSLFNYSGCCTADRELSSFVKLFSFSTVMQLLDNEAPYEEVKVTQHDDIEKGVSNHSDTLEKHSSETWYKSKDVSRLVNGPRHLEKTRIRSNTCCSEMRQKFDWRH